MSRERTALKWLIGIISFAIWVAVGRGLYSWIVKE